MDVSGRVCRNEGLRQFIHLPEPRSSIATSNSATVVAIFASAGALSPSNSKGTSLLAHAVKSGPGIAAARDSIRKIWSPACRS